MHIDVDDPKLHDYWLAGIMSDAFSEMRLESARINFDTMTGAQLLKKFEALLAVKPKKSRRKLVPAACVDEIKGAASEAEIIAAMTPKGGWKAVTLAGWGIAWPPPHGWRAKLVENFELQSV